MFGFTSYHQYWSFNIMTYKPQDWEVIELFDSTNKTVSEVARNFGLTSEQVKKILMAQPEWND
tara:strand:- start:458 stop:646 length:189 start_codon:yes stop_codon:yes gene_type:complete